MPLSRVSLITTIHRCFICKALWSGCVTASSKDYSKMKSFVSVSVYSAPDAYSYKAVLTTSHHSNIFYSVRTLVLVMVSFKNSTAIKMSPNKSRTKGFKISLYPWQVSLAPVYTWLQYSAALVQTH